MDVADDEDEDEEEDNTPCTTVGMQAAQAWLSKLRLTQQVGMYSPSDASCIVMLVSCVHQMTIGRVGRRVSAPTG
jgi:hypothetical protein